MSKAPITKAKPDSTDGRYSPNDQTHTVLLGRVVYGVNSKLLADEISHQSRTQFGISTGPFGGPGYRSGDAAPRQGKQSHAN